MSKVLLSTHKKQLIEKHFKIQRFFFDDSVVIQLIENPPPAYHFDFSTQF